MGDVRFLIFNRRIIVSNLTALLTATTSGDRRHDSVGNNYVQALLCSSPSVVRPALVVGGCNTAAYGGCSDAAALDGRCIGAFWSAAAAMWLRRRWPDTEVCGSQRLRGGQVRAAMFILIVRFVESILDLMLQGRIMFSFLVDEKLLNTSSETLITYVWADWPAQRSLWDTGYAASWKPFLEL